MEADSRFEAEGAFVLIVGPHDVLLGRGAPFLNYEGNKRFRDFVRTKRSSYVLAVNNKEKNAIAKEIADEMARRGGRFLECAHDDAAKARLGLSPDARLWRVAKGTTVLEKCKQTLRDKDPPKKKIGRAASAKRDSINESDSLAVSSYFAEPHQRRSGRNITSTPVPNTPLPPVTVQDDLGNQYLGSGHTPSPQGGWTAHPLLVSSSITDAINPASNQSIAMSMSYTAPNFPLNIVPSNNIFPLHNISSHIPSQNTTMDLQQAIQNFHQYQSQAWQLQALGQSFLASAQHQANQLNQQLQAAISIAAAFGQPPFHLPAFQLHIPTAATIPILPLHPDTEARTQDGLLISLPQHVQLQPSSTVTETPVNVAAPWPAVSNAEARALTEDLPILSQRDTTLPTSGLMLENQSSGASHWDNHLSNVQRDQSDSSRKSDQSSFCLSWSGREIQDGGDGRPTEVTTTGASSGNDGSSDDQKPSSDEQQYEHYNSTSSSEDSTGQ